MGFNVNCKDDGTDGSNGVGWRKCRQVFYFAGRVGKTCDFNQATTIGTKDRCEAAGKALYGTTYPVQELQADWQQEKNIPCCYHSFGMIYWNPKSKTSEEDYNLLSNPICVGTKDL